MIEILTRAAINADREWMRAFLAERWGDTRIVSRGRVHEASALPALIAERAGERCGLATYLIENSECELITLDATLERAGVGSALLAAVESTARAAGCRRVVLITSNDNLAALRFYQIRGYRFVAVHTDAITRARSVKPTIPISGRDGIPICDEIELERPLDSGDPAATA